MTQLLEHIQIETGPNPEIAIIWMHGLGADGSDFAGMPRELNLAGLPAIRFIFPNAPTMPISLYQGYVMRAWYDIKSENLLQREDETGLRKSQQLIETLIARENERGIPASRIILAGFSQGCALTFQTGLRHPEPLAGMMCLSGYVPLAAVISAEHTKASMATPIFMAHGRGDTVIPITHAIQSRDLLESMGYQVEWHEYPTQHCLHPDETGHIGAWMRRVLA